MLNQNRFYTYILLDPRYHGTFNYDGGKISFNFLPIYGGRGIVVCERWLKFENFLNDMGDRPTNKHILGRLDINGNYDLNNCKWMTKEEHSNNKRNTLTVNVYNISKTLNEWVKISGTNYSTIYYRLRNGWNNEEAIFGK